MGNEIALQAMNHSGGTHARNILQYVFLCLCVFVSKCQLSKGVEEALPSMLEQRQGTSWPFFEVEFAPDASICIIHTDRERKMFFLQISSQGTPGTPFSVYWVRLSHMDAFMAGMELLDDDPVHAEIWKCLEQGTDGKQ